MWVWTTAYTKLLNARLFLFFVACTLALFYKYRSSWTSYELAISTYQLTSRLYDWSSSSTRWSTSGTSHRFKMFAHLFTHNIAPTILHPAHTNLFKWMTSSCIWRKILWTGSAGCLEGSQAALKQSVGCCSDFARVLWVYDIDRFCHWSWSNWVFLGQRIAFGKGRPSDRGISPGFRLRWL